MDCTTVASTLHDQALELAARGFAIIPVHDTSRGQCSCRKGAGCTSAGKHPRVKEWTAAGSSDPDQLRDWWRRWPAANIGIVTGQQSGIVVFDFDPRHGGETTLRDLNQQVPDVRKTYRVKTGGGGWHLYWQLPAAGAVSRAGVMPGLDIRGDGGMVVAPGSIHASGGVYVVQNLAAILPLPPAFLPLIHPRTQEGHKKDTRETQERRKQDTRCVSLVSGVQKNPLDLATLSDTQKQQIRTAIKRSIPDRAGVRNQHVFQFARRLLAVDGIDQETDPESLRPFVIKFHEDTMTAAAQLEFSVNGSCAETMDDFRFAWPRIVRPQQDVMLEAIEQCRQAIQTGAFPDPVRDCLEHLGYIAESETAALVLLCWFLGQHWQPVPFFLGVRAGENALSQLGFPSISFQTVSRRFLCLERDGVLKCTFKAKPGQREAASEYIWTWQQPDRPAPQLDWLT